MRDDRVFETRMGNFPFGLLDALGASDSCAYCKDHELRYVWLNTAHGTLLGLSDPHQAIGKADRGIFSREAALALGQIETNVLKTGKASRETVTGIPCPDGVRRSFVVALTPLAEGGRISGLFGLWTDVGCLLKDHEELRKQKAFFEGLFSDATAMATVTDTDGVIIRANKKAAELFIGREDGDCLIAGRNIMEFIHDDDKPKVIDLWKESMQEKKGVNYQMRMKAFDGRILYMLISGRPIMENGEIISFLYQALDMIDLKVQEQKLLQTSSIETVGQLAGGFAHDFNNLLTVINGYSEMMLNSIDKAHPFYSKIFQICQAGSQASVLTQKILEFSRKTMPEMRNLDLNQELSNQEMILKHFIGPNIRLVIEKGEVLNAVKIDPTQFSKMLVNLVINARDAMPKGGEITITTDVKVVDGSNAPDYDDIQQGSYLLLCVRDTGVGMSEEIKRHIFDPFFTTREKGKGIGLWTVNSIVKAAGGTVHVESAPGAGTTFKILLPFSKEGGAVKSGSDEAVEKKIPAGTEGKTILVVEDDDIVRDLVREILKQKGHNILTARNGGDALQLARQYEGKIDLLITDMVMRRIDGIMLSKKMQSILPDIKVMLMSGYGNDLVRKEELRDIAFLQKPFLPNELVQKVGTMFSCAG